MPSAPARLWLTRAHIRAASVSLGGVAQPNPGAPWPPAPGMALVGSGSAVPSASVSDAQLSSRVDTNDDWIRTPHWHRRPPGGRAR
jgi:hypothetical protein